MDRRSIRINFPQWRLGVNIFVFRAQGVFCAVVFLETPLCEFYYSFFSTSALWQAAPSTRISSVWRFEVLLIRALLLLMSPICLFRFCPDVSTETLLKIKLLAITSSLTMGVFGTLKEIVQASSLWDDRWWLGVSPS